MKVVYLLILTLYSVFVHAADLYKTDRQAWLQKAEELKPTLNESEKLPVSIVNVVKDKNSYQGCKAIYNMPADSIYAWKLNSRSGMIIDFGEHMTGHFTFSLKQFNRTPDAPVQLKLTFGEVPSEMITPFDPYTGSLSRAWLQDEIVTVMTIPQMITIPRRLAFRYVKIEIIAMPNYEFGIGYMGCRSITSASITPAPIAEQSSDIIKQIDKVGLNTLKECMQTVYEDGPKRDQRLWIGDLYLESMANNYSFKQYDITKRCLYLLAALSDENGFLNATVFERPTPPHPQAKQFLLEYALLYNVALRDYLVASDDRQTAEDLWPVAKKQIDIAHNYLQSNGLMDFNRANSEWWIFFDWKDGLYKEVALQGVTIFALTHTYDLAKMLGKESEVAQLPAMIKKMTVAAQKHFYDKQSGLFVGLGDKQISYASQIWMVLSGVAQKQQAQRALKALSTTENVCRPGTPYLYHYYIQALLDSGLVDESKEALVDYWGGMVNKGADTFWEAYDPQNDYISPYNFFPMNSYCHAWSCTPVYFIRKYPQIFQTGK